MRKLDIAEQSHIWGGDASLLPIKFQNGDGTAIGENRAPNSHEQSIISSFSPTSPFSNTTQGKMQEDFTDGLQCFWGHSAIDNDYIISEEYLPDGSPGSLLISGGPNNGYFLYGELTPGMQQWDQQHQALASNGISDPQHNWSTTVEGLPAQDVWFGDGDDGGDINNAKWG